MIAADPSPAAPIIHPPQNPPHVRYIKLGPGGQWARRCFARDELHFGEASDPIDVCLNADWEGARKHMVETLGRSPGPATDAVREFRDFFALPAGTLWVTFSDGHLWWSTCEAEVFDLRGTPGQHGAVMRKVYGWQKTSILGEPLRVDFLSTRLSKVAAYQRTICRIEDAEYLLRKINGLEEPGTLRAREAMAGVVVCAQEMIARLHEREFELLADLLLTHLGWSRISALGGPMPDVDLIIEQLATGERAFVQVKSRATQAVVDDYIDRFRASGLDRMFFLCHSAKGALSCRDERKAHIWTGDELAEKAITAGLFKWLIDRIA